MSFVSELDPKPLWKHFDEILAIPRPSTREEAMRRYVLDLATGTTLGADNGIGVAALLAVMEADDLVHGPLELLFTVDEETGLTGAVALDPQAIALRGRQLLNLDSEEEHAVTIGCAGGAITRIVLPLSDCPGSRAGTRAWRSTSSAAAPSSSWPALCTRPAHCIWVVSRGETSRTLWPGRHRHG
jgi:di/tripeptidase